MIYLATRERLYSAFQIEPSGLKAIQYTQLFG